jgi:YD repeat-containing protein
MDRMTYWDAGPMPGGSGCGCGSGGGCSCGGSCEPVCDLPGIDQAQQAIKSLRPLMSPAIPQPPQGPAHLNPANGNLVVTLRPPRSGPFDPVPQLTYNSRAADQAIQYGYGWAEVFNPVVSLVSATEVHLINGVGAVHPYRDKDSLGRYLAPAGASNALATVAGGGWVETRPDGFQRRYDSTGSLSRLVSPAGRIWTVQHSGDLVTSIQSPIGTRTTYGYDGSDRLRSIQDSSGRRTTVTINANWDLTEWIRPDGTIITFVYDMSHKLRAIVDPEGHSASYEYDCLRRASSIETPAGDLYTYTYGLANAVIEPSGQRTTLEFDAQRKPHDAGLCDDFQPSRAT